MTSTGQSRITLLLSLAALIVAFGLTGLNLVAQTTNADILGTVSDQTGAVVPNANVTVSSLETGQSRAMTTTSTGDYVFTALRVGRYAVSVSAPGFKKFSAPNIVIAAGDRLRVDAHLLPGAATESIVVQDIATGLQTDSSSSGDLVGQRAVQDLPLDGRNYVNLIQVTAGVNAAQPTSLQSGNRNSDRRSTSAFSANGQQDVFNNNMIDGLDNNAGGLVGVKPSVEGIEEIKILTNNYTAEVGRAAGAVVNIITKSGTNDFHGSAFEYVRNDMFDSRYFFAKTGSKPEFRLNQFGGSIGGPIFKNKTFFFGDAEAYRKIKAYTSLYTVPTAFEMANVGNFSDRCGTAPGCVIPSAAINSIGRNFFNLYPATGQIPGLFSNNYQGTVKDTQDLITVDARLDHHFTPNDALFVRYAYNPVQTYDPSPFPAVNGIQSGGSLNGISGHNNMTLQNGQIEYSHIFKPTLLMELRAGYTRFDQSTSPLNYGKNIPQSWGMNNVNLPSLPGTSGLTLVYPTGYSFLGDTGFMPATTKHNVYQMNGAVTWLHGAHSFKLGAGLIKREAASISNEFPTGLMVFSPLSILAYGINWLYGVSDMLYGVPLAILRGNGMQPAIYEFWEPSVYLQDDWHATKNLTLNLGLRYEVFPPNSEKRNRIANFDLSTLSLVQASSSNPHLGVATGYGNVSPRIGFALELPHQAAIHGGAGMTYYSQTLAASQIGSGNPPSTFYNQTSFPLTSISNMVVPSLVDVTKLATNSTITTVNNWPKHFSDSYIYQLSMEVQKQFGANVATVGYVGELGRRLLWSYNANEPLPPGPPAAGVTTPIMPAYVYQTQYPYLTTITVNNNAATMSYHALKGQIQRRTANGLTVNINYTYARGLSSSFSTDAYNGSSGIQGGSYAGNTRYDYGNSDFDVRHRLAGSIAYELPFGKNLTGAKGALLKGWQANTLAYWQTGVPFSVTDSTVVPAYLYGSKSPTTTGWNLLPPGGPGARPNMVHSAHLSNSSITQFFDPTAFQLQTQGTLGNEHRNQIYGPHDRRMDFSLIKTFPIYERMKLQFRAESFNIFNIPNFAAPNTAITKWQTEAAGSTPDSNKADTNFGSISSTSVSEVPREFQLALKLMF